MYEEIREPIYLAAKKRNFHEETIKNYYNDVRHFLRFTGKDVSDLDISDVDDFLTWKRMNGSSPDNHNRYRAAIKFFFKKVLKKPWDDDEIPQMKRDRSLPVVISRKEIDSVIEATTNLKHKSMIALMYSSGLRVSEVIHLHYDDISRTDMSVHVRECKSRIDHYTILSEKCLDILTEYWITCGRPRGILFPSARTASYLCVTSVEAFFQQSVVKAGITRRLTPHACRHGFATHLYENGTDIRHIQSALGHVDPNSTEIYIHVSNKRLLGVKSPYDDPKGGAE